MEYALIHCYSDLNSGDLGIILATIETIKKYDKQSKINIFSTFNHNDIRFVDHHRELRKYAPNIFPAIYGILGGGLNNRYIENVFYKTVSFVAGFVRFNLVRWFPENGFILKLCLNKHERRTLEKLKESDIIISKGGSFLCTEKNLRSKFAFYRLSFIFFLLKKIKKEYYILGQSLGPVYGSWAPWVLNRILQGCRGIYLREDVCLRRYNIKIPGPYFVMNDVAFLLDKKETFNCAVDDPNVGMKVGVTLKVMNRDLTPEYNEMILNTFQYLFDQFNAKIYIFPQVLIDNDLLMAEEIFEQLEEKYHENIVVYREYMNPFHLKYCYSKMDFFIATRLHSAIFALSEGVPAINISYHGTKSQGIFASLGLTDFLLEPCQYKSSLLIGKIKKLRINQKQLKQDISHRLEIIKKELHEVFKKLINDNKTRPHIGQYRKQDQSGKP